MFACCREIFNPEQKKMFVAEESPLGWTKEEIEAMNTPEPEQASQTEESKQAARGDTGTEKVHKLANFTFVFGCKPGFGVYANTSFVADIVSLFKREADLDTNSFLLPEVFSKIQSNDANFEMVTSNVGQQMLVAHQNDIVSQVVVIFAKPEDEENMDIV